MEKSLGYKNEYDFVLNFNNKKIKELDPISYDLIHNIYQNVDDESIIKAWKNHYKQKGDILISINNIVKSISIKMGAKNSIHTEPITEFIHFLIQNHVPREVIISYLKFHYADGTTNGNGKKRISTKEYKETYQNEIDVINSYFSNKSLIKKCIERFILKGTNCDYSISALIYGTIDSYLYLTKADIIKIILAKHNIQSSGLHFGPLFVQPKARNLVYNPLYEKDRYCVQIKWFSLFDDILEYLYYNSLPTTDGK